MSPVRSRSPAPIQSSRSRKLALGVGSSFLPGVKSRLFHRPIAYFDMCLTRTLAKRRRRRHRVASDSQAGAGPENLVTLDSMCNLGIRFDLLADAVNFVFL